MSEAFTWTPEMGTDPDGCYTLPDGSCVSDVSCPHTALAGTVQGDDSPVLFGYSSSHNESFQGTYNSPYNRGERRVMTLEERAAALREFRDELIDVFVED